MNVSVASALILYEAQRQLAGMYQREKSILSEEEQQKLLFEGGYPVLAAVSHRKGLEQPLIDKQGQIIASEVWWAAMQATTAPSIPIEFQDAARQQVSAANKAAN